MGHPDSNSVTSRNSPSGPREEARELGNGSGARADEFHTPAREAVTVPGGKRGLTGLTAGGQQALQETCNRPRAASVIWLSSLTFNNDGTDNGYSSRLPVSRDLPNLSYRGERTENGTTERERGGGVCRLCRGEERPVNGRAFPRGRAQFPRGKRDEAVGGWWRCRRQLVGEDVTVAAPRQRSDRGGGGGVSTLGGYDAPPCQVCGPRRCLLECRRGPIHHVSATSPVQKLPPFFPRHQEDRYTRAQ